MLSSIKNRTMKKKLRIGLLIDNYLIHAWVFKMLEKIISSEHSEIVLIVKNKKRIEKEQKNLFSTILKNRKNLLFILFQKLDNKLFKNSPDAFKQKDLHEIVNCEEIEVTPRETKFSDFILDDDIEKISSHNVDVFIRLGFRILRGKILKSSKYGIWSYHHGDNDTNRGGPAGVWEVFKDWDETGVILQILTEDLDGGVKLSESFSSTDKLSPKRNKNNYYWKALSMLPRKLNELYALGETDFFQKVDKYNSTPSFYDNRLFVSPTNLETFRASAKTYIDYVLMRIKSCFYLEQWALLFKLEKKDKLSTSFFRFKRILPPKDRFWADPFVIEKNGKYFVFIEELIYKENKGTISVFEIDEKGNYTKPQTVLEKDYHLSYPFLYEENGELYMIPETASNKTIELYKCIDFPLKWELSKVLMDNVSAVDTTITKKDDKYWLFCNIKENEGASSCEELFLFYSESLTSDTWIPHPNNPIVSDIKNSRPAGKIFSLNNKLFRPSQNCAKRYGHGMQINEIIELNENNYVEHTVQSINPNWDKDILGTHTINNDGRLTIIDAIVKRRR